MLPGMEQIRQPTRHHRKSVLSKVGCIIISIFWDWYKIHAICDALGMPVKFRLTGGQEAECRQAIPLLENVNVSAVLADKAYDTNELRKWLESRGIKAVIPPKSNRKEKIECDYWHYKERQPLNACSANLNTTGELLLDMRKSY